MDEQTKKTEEKRPVTLPEHLEKKNTPNVAISGKKTPVPAPYPPGADYGLVKRRNLLNW